MRKSGSHYVNELIFSVIIGTQARYKLMFQDSTVHAQPKSRSGFSVPESKQTPFLIAIKVLITVLMETQH